jgi:hypothetical protein
MKSILFSLLMSWGCAPKHIQFEPSGSPCIDSIIANFEYAECESIIKEVRWNELTHIRCHNPELINPWSASEFIILIPEIQFIPEDKVDVYMPFCADLHVVTLVKIEIQSSDEVSEDASNKQ